MRSRRPSRFPFLGLALVAALPSPTRAREPSARELVALAPVLDSSDPRCRTVDVGGRFAGEAAPGAGAIPELRFRAIYQAPDRFCLLLSDPVDDTPVAFCSGGRMVVYDPLRPTVYYSEDAGFLVRLAATRSALNFEALYFLTGRNSRRILVDLRSLSANMTPENGARSSDKVTRVEPNRYILDRDFGERLTMMFKIDLTKACPYTAAEVGWGERFLAVDRLALDGPVDSALFAFPSRDELARRLPLRDLTGAAGPADHEIEAAVERAVAVRRVSGLPRPPRLDGMPGLERLDRRRVREGDEKVSKVLRQLVPEGLRH